MEIDKNKLRMTVLAVICILFLPTGKDNNEVIIKNKIYNRQLQLAWAVKLECYITNNYCNEDLFQYFIPIKEFIMEDD